MKNDTIKSRIWLIPTAMAVFALNVLGGTFIEAESFATKGGWVVDQQFMDQMGSPYLLAHGMGRPVQSASATVTFNETGLHDAWVRTRDWVAPNGPGQFTVSVNGSALDTTFGQSQTGDWEWKYGGTVNITGSSNTIALNDLTGFEGRCDAIYFTPAGTTPPPSMEAALAAWRKSQLGLPVTPPVAGTYDLVVVGGGIAGCCAAVSAARLGLTVALIQNRPVLGGNNSSEIRVGLTGYFNLDPWPDMGNIVNEFGGRVGNNQSAAEYNDAGKLGVVQAESNISLFLNTHVFDVVKSGNSITGVIAKNIETGAESQFNGTYFCDATGDANLGFLAGADFRMHRESKSETAEPDAPDVAAGSDSTGMGCTNMWYATDRGTPSTFPNTSSWALNITPQCITAGAGSGRDINSPAAEWYWESGFARNRIYEGEYIRDHNFRAIYGVWDCLKNDATFASTYTNHELDFVAYIYGKRESRRLLGDVILSQQDIIMPNNYDDGLVGLSWGLDLHYPASENTACVGPGNEFLSTEWRPHVPRYEIPYRCFYSRNIDNLFMAGRNISVTHIALGSVRVMATTGMMGEVVGSAAYIAKTNTATPREVYQNHLADLKGLWTYDPPADTVPGIPSPGILVDNADATVSGNWTPVPNWHAPNFYGVNYLWANNGDTGSVTFTPDLPAAATFKVSFYSLSWTQPWDTFATNVPIYINHANGSDTVYVDQRSTMPRGEGDYKWVDLGFYAFNAGTGGNVVVSTEGTGKYEVIADAIMWEDTSGVVVDIAAHPIQHVKTGIRLSAGKSSIYFSPSFSPKRISLIDPLGRRLAVVSIPEGSNHIRIPSLRTIAGAVYFAVLENGHKVERKRFFWE